MTQAGYLKCDKDRASHADRVKYTARVLEMPYVKAYKVVDTYLKLTAAQVKMNNCSRIPHIGVLAARKRSYLGKTKVRVGLRAPVLSDQVDSIHKGRGTAVPIINRSKHWRKRKAGRRKLDNFHNMQEKSSFFQTEERNKRLGLPY